MQGAPNFRQVGGFPVFGVGQPSPAGVQAVLERTKPSPEEKPGKEDKEQAKQQQAQMGLPLKVDCFII